MKNLLNFKTLLVAIGLLVTGLTTQAWAATDTLEKGSIIYCSVENSNWQSWNIFFNWHYNTDGGDANFISGNQGTKITTDMWYSTVPNNDYVRVVELGRCSLDWGSKWDWSNKLTASSRSDNYQNCVKITGTNYGNAAVSWTTYCPAVSSFTLTPSGGTNLGGSGTEGDPYLVLCGEDITFSVSDVTSTVSDAHMTLQYHFKDGSSTLQNTTTSSYTLTTSSTANTVHHIIVEPYNRYNGTNSTGNDTEEIYYKTVQYYVAGNGGSDSGCVGDNWCDGKKWDATGSPMTYDSENSDWYITFDNVPSSSNLQFAVTNGTWTSPSPWKHSEYKSSCSANLSESNQDGNAKLTTSSPTNITIRFDPSASTGNKICASAVVRYNDLAVAISDANAAATPAISATYAISSESVTVTAYTANTGYTWAGWTTDGSGSFGNASNMSTTWTPSAGGETATANYTEHKSTITITAPSASEGSLSTTGNKSLGKTTTQALTATPAIGYKFDHWELTGVARLTTETTTNPTVVTTDGTASSTGSVTAVFVPRFGLVGSQGEGSSAGQGMPGWSEANAYDFDDITVTSISNMAVKYEATLYPNRQYRFMVYDKTLDVGRGCTSSTNTGDAQVLPAEDGGGKKKNWQLNGEHNVRINTMGYGTYTFKITALSNDANNYPSLEVERQESYVLTLGKKVIYNETEGTLTNASSEGAVTAKTNEGSGVVDGDGFAITSGQYFATGSNITFTATPATGYRVVGWYSDATCETAYDGEDTGVTISGDKKTLTLEGLEDNTTVYVKFEEIMTTVNFAATSGHVEISSSEVTSKKVGVHTTYSLTAVPNTGYYFSGWTRSATPDFHMSGYGEDNATATLTGDGAGTAGTLTANFLPLDKVYFRNWNEEGNAGAGAPLWEHVYVYFSIGYEDGYGGKAAKSNSADGYLFEMMQEGTSNVYWAYVPRVTTRYNNYDIAFSDYNFGANYKFNGHNAVMRGDYRASMNMFVPRHASTYGINYTTYYNGYWKHHNVEAGTYSGYQIKRYDNDTKTYVDPADNGGDKLKFFVANENSIQYTLRVDNLTSGHNKFMIFSDGEKHYITYNESTSETGYNISTSNCSNVHMSEYNSGSPRFEILPTSEGDYVLTIDMTGDEMKLSVNYPVAVGDYRLKHTYVINETTYTTYSDVIKNGVTSTASMYINTSSATKTLTLWKCTAVSPSVTWEQQGDNLWASKGGSFDKGKGVYQFDIAITNGTPSTISSISNVGLYKGNFYIKTDCAPGGWTSYKANILSKNTINFSTSDANTFDYYFCKNVTPSGKNVKFVIANDYNIAITDSIKADNTYLVDGGGGTSGTREYTPEASCVRFSYNSYTNDAKRAYMRYSSVAENNFLNIVTKDDEVYSDAEGSSDLYGAAAASTKFSEDDGNFVYKKTVYVKSGATLDVKATYNSSDQSFVTGKGTITSNNAAGIYPMHLIYDFKTNNLTAAWYPGNTAVADKISTVEYMYVRNGHDAADQLSFGVNGSLSTATVFGVFEFKYSDYVGKVATWPGEDGYTNEKCMFYFSFPFEVNVSDIFGIGTYGKEWKIQYYDGAERAEKGFYRGDGTTTFWKDMPITGKLEPYVGYSLLLDNDYFNTNTTGMVFEGKTSGSVYLYFPSSKTMSSVTSTSKVVPVPEHTCNKGAFTNDPSKSHANTDSHWNMLGLPLLNNASGDFSGYFTQSGLSYLYNWDPATNTLSAAATGSSAGSVGNFTFKAMGAYMVQFHGDIEFTGIVPTPASVAARQAKETKNYIIDLEVLDGNDERINHTYVELREGASDDFVLNEDMYMAPNSKNVNVYSFAGAYDVAANVLSMKNQVVPVGVIVKKAGTYKFSMPYEFTGTVTLYDTYTDARTNLSLDEYEVSLPKGECNDRFLLEIDIRKVPTSIENIDGNNALNDGGVHKFIMNDQMYILKNGVIYDARGNRVR